MTLPLYMKNAFDYPTAMAIATVLGFLFGFVLERSGFGRAINLAAQFYGRDMRVLKVMFGAIVTTTVGLGILGGIGMVDMSALSIPETYIGPQVVGGLLLGIGFILSGYCPGTAVVATASGYLDGIISLLGVMVGSLVFAVIYPSIAPFYLSGGMGKITLPDFVNLPWVVVSVIVVLVAIGAFFFAEWVERWVAKREGKPAPESPALLRNGVFAGLGAASVLGLATLLIPAPDTAVGSPPRSVGSVTSLALAKELLSSDGPIYLLDSRAPEVCAKKRIPGAMCLPTDDLEANLFADFPPTRPLVVYDADGTTPVPKGALRYPGVIRTLDGGYAGFTKDILTVPTPPEVPTARTIAEYQLKVVLQGRFTGAKTERAAVIIKPKAVKRKVKKGGGC